VSLLLSEDSDTHECMSATEAARFLNLDPRTVLRGLERGEIPGRRVGRRWVVLRSALVAWLSTSERKAA
jgi:excisionase family DNA binding protein